MGPLTLHTISVFILIGLIGGAFLFWKRSHEEHYEDDQVFDVLLSAFLGGALIGRLGYIFFHFPDFRFDFISWIAITVRPGINEVFAIIGMAIVLAWQAKKRKWNHFELLDYLPLSLAFFFIVLWIGRFFAGAYIGTQTALPIGVSFPTVFDVRHPVQLYYVVGFFLLFLLLKYFESRYRFFAWYRGNKQSAEAGFLLGVFFIFFGLLRIGLGFLHGADMIIVGIPLDRVVFLTVSMSGFLVILLQSGRFHRRKQKRRLQLGKEGRRSRGIFWKRLFRLRKPTLEEE